MNWRRGLLLAGINLAVAVPMILMMEARDQKYALTQEEIMAKTARVDTPRPAESPTPESQLASSEPAEENVGFEPCSIWAGYPVPVQVALLQAVDMPSVALAGWEDVCPSHWSLAGSLRERTTWPPTPLWIETQREIDAGLCLLIAIQWFLLGGFPLVRTGKWWADPGAFITACAVLAGAIALIPVFGVFARLPALFAMLAWLWWFGLLVWKALQFGWRMTTTWRASLSN
jgi:hypothetical protein